MLRARLIPTLHAGALGVIGLAALAHAESAVSPGMLHEIPLRGGLRGALSAIGDRVPPDRSHFLLEVIQRVYDTPPTMQKTPREAMLQALLTHIDRSAIRSSTQETLPLPLSPNTWIDTVFGGHANVETLVSSILRSRSSSLLYYGLLSLDDATRAWLAGQPDLISELALTHSAALVVAAPGLRISENTVRVPGGTSAEPVWQALAGRGVHEPGAFIRALLTHGEGRLAYFFGAMASLTPAQIRFALNLDSPDPAGRVDAGRRLYAIFDRLAADWKIGDRPFWRPTLDPALLVSDLRPDATGLLILPGTRALWTAVFQNGDVQTASPGGAEVRALVTGEPVDLRWLCEQIFKDGLSVTRRPYQMVLFASRIVGRITPDNVLDAIDAIRAAGTYPALVAALERARITDAAVFAGAARRARQLSAVDDRTRATRALAQFQGSLVLLTRAALRKSLTGETLTALVSSLSAVELSNQREYDGRLVRWWMDVIDARLNAMPNHGSESSNAPAWDGEAYLHRYEDTLGPMDREVIRLIAGPISAESRFVEWEGTRYRLDLARAEAIRLGKLLGEQPRPYLSSARALLEIADALSEAGLTRETLQEQTARTEKVAQITAWRGLDTAVANLRRASATGDVGSPQRLASIASALRGVADDLFARGLTEIVYAIALGQPDRALISAADAASRHDFGIRLLGRAGAWRFPAAGSDRLRDWHATGSLLGLDVRLAEFALVRVSSRLPPGRPTVGDADRRVFVEAVALMEAASLTEADRDTIVAAIRKGRTRLAATRTQDDVATVADDIRLSALRRNLLAWAVVHDPERVAAFLSPSELLWLGLEAQPIDPKLHVWGAPGEPRLGCLCLQLPDRRPLETLTGRWDSGIFVSGFADLNLRLAELLADLDMPAPLLAPVLASATVDLVNTAVSRGQDDRRGLVEFVQALEAERVELYLTQLTTDGPLVVIGDASEPPPAGTVRKTEVSR